VSDLCMKRMLILIASAACLCGCHTRMDSGYGGATTTTYSTTGPYTEDGYGTAYFSDDNKNSAGAGARAMTGRPQQ